MTFNRILVVVVLLTVLGVIVGGILRTHALHGPDEGLGTTPPVPEPGEHGALTQIPYHLALYNLQFSPDGRVLAVAARGLMGATPAVFDLIAMPSAHLARRLLAGGDITETRFLEDGRTLLSVVYGEYHPSRGSPYLIRSWDWRSGKPRRIQQLPMREGAPARVLAVSADGRYLAVAADYNDSYVWDMEGGEVLRRLPRMEFDLEGVHVPGSGAFSPDGRYLALSSDTWSETGPVAGEYSLIDATSWRLICNVKVNDPQDRESAGGVAFSSDSSVVAVALTDAVALRRCRDGSLIEKIPVPAQEVAFSPDGSLLAALDGTTVTIWHRSNRRIVKQWQPSGAWTGCFAISPDGRVIATGGNDGVLRLWPMPHP